MKKWHMLVKIGCGVFLCVFLIEYLHPAALGVRANCSLSSSSEYDSSLDHKYPPSQKSEPLAWVRGDHDPGAAKGPSQFDKHSIEEKNIAHAMVWHYPVSIDRAFPELKFQLAQEIQSNPLIFEEIYHPPRLTVLFPS